jgi:hypothetical protein
MALSITLSTAISTDREDWDLTDETIYGVGGNPARSAVAVFVTAYKTDIDSAETELTVESDDDDPETDSVWTIEYTEDGAYKIPFVIIPDFNSATTYAQYDAVYSGGVVYRSLQASNTTDTLTDEDWWEVISDPSDLANNKDTATESANITSQVYLRVFSAHGEYYYSNELSKVSINSDADEGSVLQSYNAWAMMIDQIAIADSRSEVLDGERIARTMESRFIDPLD